MFRIASAPTLRQAPAAIKKSSATGPLPAVRSDSKETPTAEASSLTAQQVSKATTSGAARKGSKQKKKDRMVTITFGRQADEGATKRQQDVTEEKVVPTFSEANMARELHLPFDVMHDGVTVFKKHVDFVEGTNLMTYELSMDDFAAVLCEVTGSSSLRDLSEGFVEKAFKAADRDGSGSIDVYEFVIWHASIAFNEEVSMGAEDRDMRRIARDLDVELLELDRYRKAFVAFDTDGSGEIELDEFTEILNVLLKVPEGQRLPDDRVNSMWRQADKLNAGALDFEQFCHFYRANFDEAAECLLADFYHSLRRV